MKREKTTRFVEKPLAWHAVDSLEACSVNGKKHFLGDFGGIGSVALWDKRHTEDPIGGQ